MNKSSQNYPSNTTRNSARGFTLVEILIVLALIGIVAGLGMKNLTGLFSEGKERAAQTWVNSTGPAYINSYLAIVGEYPNSLNDLLNPPDGITPFVNKASDLEVPWSTKQNPIQYQYTLQGSSFEIFTTDPDGKRISNKATSN